MQSACAYIYICVCVVEGRRQMENLMDKTLYGWHEVENKEKVVVVRTLGYEGQWRNCTGGDLLKG